MRILQVRFKNLNSLSGEWDIDLTHPAFTSDGIFAITGPTGAGKTTILDAICLALYGRTPRLNKVTKSGNEIMSRQTGECFAEVTFETQSGRFRCHWSQHRARKKPDGELQAPKHEISNADSGEIFESKLRGVADQIVAVTGMDFDRFTRSMLLAQGGFAAFLQAAPDERAPILEQITGTEIYSQISIRVHERRYQERKQLDTLQAAIAGMQLLTQEEEQKLSESLDGKGKQDTELAKQIGEKNQAIAWIGGINSLENELKALDQEKTDLLSRIEKFAPDQERLRLASQALEISADYAALTAIRKARDADQALLSECQTNLPGSANAAKLAENDQKIASEKHASRKAELQGLLPIIRKVHELDLKINEKESPIKAESDSVTELSSFLENLQTKQNNDSDDLQIQRTTLGDLRPKLDASVVDEKLVEHLTGLRSKFDVMKEHYEQLAENLKESARVKTQLTDAIDSCQKQTALQREEKAVLEKSKSALSDKQSTLTNVLDGKSVAEWRRYESTLTAQNGLISKTLDAVGALKKSSQASTRLEKGINALRKEESTLTSTLEIQAGKRTSLETEIGLLETQLTLIKRIEDLEEARNQLQDGEPCPLCGAKDHPFAEGNIPAPDETQNRLALLRGEYKVLATEISGYKVKLAEVVKDIERSSDSMKEHVEKSAEASRTINENCAKLDFELVDPASTEPDLSKKLSSLQEENTRQIARANEILEAAESVEAELTTLRDSIEKARESVARHDREVLEAVHKKESIVQLQERLRKEEAIYQKRQNQSLSALQKEINPYGIQGLAVETIDVVYEKLVERRDQWVSGSKKCNEIEQKIAALEIQERHQNEQIIRTETDIKNHKTLLAGLLRDQETLRSERRELFGDKSAEDEEKRITEAVESDSQELDIARQKSVTANQALSQLKTKVAELGNSIQTRDHQLKLADKSFLERLTKSGFTDEDNYKSSCLPDDERKRLAMHAQKLSDDKTEISSREREKSQKLETERQRKVTEESLENLNEAVRGLTGTLRELQQEIGGIRQKLKDNDRIKQQLQERAQAIETQKRECERWELLHELIGSADGKKYRNFAQGLTFEMMIGHANRQLQKMSDRYLLIRDDAQPLELSVVDNYQAGEIRTTKNLSGGESFIVSLSLALGLSHMASKNVRVDSLFLDEGFGTLDDEALDTALETLAGLQQDGKLIGVISHVSTLKERISTQIQVTPQTGGRSQLSGPGCERVSATI